MDVKDSILIQAIQNLRRIGSHVWNATKYIFTIYYSCGVGRGHFDNDDLEGDYLSSCFA